MNWWKWADRWMLPTIGIVGLIVTGLICSAAAFLDAINFRFEMSLRALAITVLCGLLGLALFYVSASLKRALGLL